MAGKEGEAELPRSCLLGPPLTSHSQNMGEAFASLVLLGSSFHWLLPDTRSKDK